MPTTIQDFVADATLKASKDLTTAFLRIPEDKRDWSPDGKARTALDQYAECALLNGYTAVTLATRQMAAGSMENFSREMTKLKAQDWEQTYALFQANTAQVLTAIRAISEEGMGVEMPMPWGPMTAGQIMAYSQWNMTYHEGQINYLASLLGCLG